MSDNILRRPPLPTSAHASAATTTVPVSARKSSRPDVAAFPSPAPVPSSRLWRLFAATLRIIFRPIREVFFLLTWIVWLFSSITLGTGHLSIVLYSAIRITISLLLYLVVFVSFRILAVLQSIYTRCLCFSQRHLPRAEQIRLQKIALDESESLDHWQQTALELDNLCGFSTWKNTLHSEVYDYKMMKHISAELIRFRMNADYRGLCFHLSNILNRQFCNIQSEQLYSVAYHGTKFQIEEFYGRVVEQLSFLCKTDFGPEFSTRHKLRFFQRARRTLGRTALCLSGGGALAMYHTGVARAMIKGHCLPSIINGTSGGSIIAALIGTRTDEELKDPSFFAPKLCHRYGAEHRWLPTLQQQVDVFIKKRVLMDHEVFSRTARTFFGMLTFEEAYRRTSREVCITVTYVRSSAGKPHPLVLNHITSPNVFVWSAVTCSCALPGLMTAQNLFAKGPHGEVVEYFPRGSEVVDGSLQADIPVQRLTELFNAQTFIVSQTNPHVIPLVRDGSEGRGKGFEDELLAAQQEQAAHVQDERSNNCSASSFFHSSSSSSGSSSRSNLNGTFAKIHAMLTSGEKFLQADIGHRLKRLAKMRVIPKIYNNDFTHVIAGTQTYTGDINIVPRIPFLMRFKALTHPSVDDMVEYFRGGEQATYPKVARIQNCMLLERTLEECVRSLMKQLKYDEKGRRMKSKPFGASDATATTTMPPSTQAASAIPQQPSSGPAAARATPRKSAAASVPGVVLPDAFDVASTSFHHTPAPHSISTLHSNAQSTPTANVLAQLPLHGADATVVTDHEADDIAQRAASDGALAALKSGMHMQHAFLLSPRRLEDGAVVQQKKGTSSNSSSAVSSSSSLSDMDGRATTDGIDEGALSDESTTSTAADVDGQSTFELDELANFELVTELEEHRNHTYSLNK